MEQGLLTYVLYSSRILLLSSSLIRKNTALLNFWSEQGLLLYNEIVALDFHPHPKILAQISDIVSTASPAYFSKPTLHEQMFSWSAIRFSFSSLRKEKRSWILCLYGGMPNRDRCYEWTKCEKRVKKELEGGVSELVLVCAFSVLFREA